jgi:hypothetical protein
MIGRLFERKAGYEAELLAEAQALVDDGLDIPFVLGLFPDDASWLEGMLATADIIGETFATEAPSYYFEASLKSKFVSGVREAKPVVPVILPAPTYSPARTAIASMSVATAAAGVGILALGFITAGSAVPGDWNYTFKLADERFEYTLSRGDNRVDVQLRQTEQRVYELQRLNDRGKASSAQVESLQREIDNLNLLAQHQEFDDVQKARVESLGKVSAAVLNDVKKSPDVDPVRVDAVAAAINNTVSTALGEPPPPTPTATAAAPTATTTATGTVSPTATASATATETPLPSPTATATPTPTATEEPSPTQTATRQPVEEDTATPSSTATPTP